MNHPLDGFDRAQDEKVARDLRSALERYDGASEASERDEAGADVVRAARAAWDHARHIIWRRETLRTLARAAAR